MTARLRIRIASGRSFERSSVIRKAIASNKPIKVTAESNCKSLTSGVRKLRAPEELGMWVSAEKRITQLRLFALILGRTLWSTEALLGIPN